jgi:hypothetical protein
VQSYGPAHDQLPRPSSSSARFELRHPETDEVAWDIVLAGEEMEDFARNELLRDVTFGLDALGTVPGHGLQSPATSVIPNL